MSEEYWEPHLARLNNQGKYNAWSTEQNSSWIQVSVVFVCVCVCVHLFDNQYILYHLKLHLFQQVDFQRPVIISQVATQGAKQLFYSQFVRKYLISYSTDRRKWTFYKGDSKAFMKVEEILVTALLMSQTGGGLSDHFHASVLSLSLSMTRYSLVTRKPMRLKQTPSFLPWLDGS